MRAPGPAADRSSSGPATGTSIPSSARRPDRRSAPPSVEAHSATAYPASASARTWAAMRVAVAQDRLPPPALDLGDVRTSAVGTRETTAAPVRASIRSKGTCSRGASTPSASPQVSASASASADSSSSSSAARSRTRRGSTRTTSGVVTEQVADELLALHQPREPRLHAVELLGVGDAVPLVAAPGRAAHEGRRPVRAWPRRPPARGSRTARPVRGPRPTAGRPRRTGSAGRPRRPTGRCGPARRPSTGTRRRCRPGRPARPGARRSTPAGRQPRRTRYGDGPVGDSIRAPRPPRRGAEREGAAVTRQGPTSLQDGLDRAPHH